MPYKMDCHQWSVASEASGIEVVWVRREEAPAFSSAVMRCLQTGNKRANTFGAFDDAKFLTSSPAASTAFARQVVVINS